MAMIKKHLYRLILNSFQHKSEIDFREGKMKLIMSLSIISLSSALYAASAIIESNEKGVTKCDYIGNYTGSSGWGNAASDLGIKNSKNEAIEKAEKDNVTHIVWVTENRGFTTSVVGEGYKCSKKIKKKPKVSSKVKLIAIGDFNFNGIMQSEVDIIKDMISSSLQNTGKYRLIERGQIDQILNEQGLENSGVCDNTECAIELGKILSIDEILIGSVGRLGRSIVISIKIVNIETSEVILNEKKQYKGEIDDIGQYIDEIVSEI